MCDLLCSKTPLAPEPGPQTREPAVAPATPRRHARRQFLKAAGSATAAMGLSGAFPRLAHAAVWGDVPPSLWPSPPDLKVLEIHLLGGVAPFESFYFRPPLGVRTRGFDAEIAGLTWNTPTCPNTPSGLESQIPFSALPFFANDSNTKEIRLGPFAKPLWRTDIFNRMRVIVLSHNLLPHEAAIPFALTGLPSMLQNTDTHVAKVQAPPAWWPSAPGFWPVSKLWESSSTPPRSWPPWGPGS